MNISTRDDGASRELVPAGVASAMDREAMRDWIQMLRREASSLRQQANHMNTVARDADALADRIDDVLQSV